MFTGKSKTRATLEELLAVARTRFPLHPLLILLLCFAFRFVHLLFEMFSFPISLFVLIGLVSVLVSLRHFGEVSVKGHQLTESVFDPHLTKFRIHGVGYSLDSCKNMLWRKHERFALRQAIRIGN